MKPNPTFSKASASLSEFWAARNARERRIITIALSLAILALVYSLLIDPAVSGRQRLTAELPQLRQQVAQMQALARDAANVAGTTVTAAEPVSKESLEASLSRKGLKAQSIGFTGDIARVQLSGAPFPALLDWVDEMQKTALISVLEANIIAQAQPGMVDATLTLRQQKGE
jgi:general secretion pathway protein M